MKSLKLMAILFIALLLSCGGKEEKEKEGFTLKKKTETESTVAAKDNNTLASVRIDLENKGIGPIKSVQLGTDINQAMVTHGADVYKKMCMACHRPDKKLIGPAPT
jgi:mono/diheme cytochrome c family protein